MSEKSHVSLEQKVCPVCAQTHDVGVLLHKRLAKTLEPRTVTGWAMCPEHARLEGEGYIALVGVDRDKSTDMTLGGVYRTGDIAHIRAEVFGELLNVPTPQTPLVLVDPETIEQLKTKWPQ